MWSDRRMTPTQAEEALGPMVVTQKESATPAALSSAKQEATFPSPADVQHDIDALRRLTNCVLSLLRARDEMIGVCRGKSRAERSRGWTSAAAEIAAHLLTYYLTRLTQLGDTAADLGTPLKRWLDVASGGYARICGSTADNMHDAVAHLCLRGRRRAKRVGFCWIPCEQQDCLSPQRRHAWLRQMQMPARNMVEWLASEQRPLADRVRRLLQEEAAAAAAQIAVGEHAWMWCDEPLRPTTLEIEVLQTLARTAKGMTADELVNSVDGCTRQLLSLMRERGMIENDRRRGGYVLPAWNKRVEPP